MPKPAEPEDPLLSDLRRFILSFGEHDPECPGSDATGQMAVDGGLCSCGFIPRMDELLTETARRIRKN
jgi:hypothetical protein